jgi:transposase
MIALTETKRDEATREYYLAPDLSAWLSKPTLARLVARVTQTVDEARLWTVEPAAGKTAPAPRQILMLLTYAYAVGIHRSCNIEQLIRQDATLRGYFAVNPPDHELIRRFRHKNRELIEECLEKVCLVAWKLRFGTWHCARSARQSSRSVPTRCRIDPLFRLQILCEVRERLNKAQQLDHRPFDGLAAA